MVIRISDLQDNNVTELYFTLFLSLPLLQEVKFLKSLRYMQTPLRTTIYNKQKRDSRRKYLWPVLFGRFCKFTLKSPRILDTNDDIS